MPGSDGNFWLHCSACRKDIFFRATHWVCSVSTCNRNRTRLVFCSVACWDSHVATLRHRDAWAVEARAPSREEHAQQEENAHREAVQPGAGVSRDSAFALRPTIRAPSASEVGPPRPPSEPARHRVMASLSLPGSGAGSAVTTVTAHAGGPALSNSYQHDDVLIVVSKMKKYIRDRSGMNTSDAVAEALGDHVRRICDEAIRIATNDGRKTVLDRDVPKPSR